VLRQQAQSDKTLGQLTVSLFSHQFVARMPPPEINSGALKELAGSAAEKLDQRSRIGSFGRFRRNPQKEFLKRLIGTAVGAGFRRRRQVASCHGQSLTECRQTILAILTSD
jgi:hypothetical protein